MCGGTGAHDVGLCRPNHLVPARAVNGGLSLLGCPTETTRGGWKCDKRKWIGRGESCITKRAASGPKPGLIDVFRMQLWWDHLPSPEMLLNPGESDPSLANCPYCSEGVR